MPRVSAIITTFNRPQFLRKAIASVLQQEFADFELIVLDNSSGPETVQAVESFQDNRIRFVRHEPLKISQARNRGVREAKGEFIAFLDDDDEWMPSKLALEVGLFDRGSAKLGLTYGGFLWFTDQGKILHEHHPKLRGSILPELLWQKDPFTGSASNPMLRRNLVVTLGGYDESVVTGEDWELYLRLAEAHEVDCTPEIVVRIRQHDGPRLGDKLKEAAGLELMVMERYRETFDREPSLKGYYLQKIAGKHFRIGENRQGRRYLSQAVRANGWNRTAFGQYVLSFLGKGAYLRFHRAYQNARRRDLP